jgi:hypothetical protein
VSAGPATARAPLDPRGPCAGTPGRTRIASGALTRLLQAITAEVFAVPADAVKARIEDDAGLLRVAVAVSLAVPPLLGDPATPGDSLYGRASGARAAIIARAQELAGTAVSRVDIRLTGIHQERQVRAL